MASVGNPLDRFAEFDESSPVWASMGAPVLPQAKSQHDSSSRSGIEQRPL